MWYDLTAAQTRSVQPTCASASFALTNLREVLQVENMKRVAMTKSIGERMHSNLRSSESGGSLWEAARLMRKSDVSLVEWQLRSRRDVVSAECQPKRHSYCARVVATELAH